MKLHSLTKRNRRPKNSNRKDFTRATMLAIRELQAKVNPPAPAPQK
jgi:hypothetical protein